MRVALFTGAGASKAFGFPLTSEILPNIRARLKSSRRRDDRALRRFIRSIFPGFEAARDGDLPLITDLLSIIDSSVQSLGALGQRDGHSMLRTHRRQLEKAIIDSFGWLEDYDPDDEADAACLSRLETMARWLRALYGSEHIAGLISTNYDMILESTFRGDGPGRLRQISEADLRASIDLGFGWRPPYELEVVPRPATPKFCCYKLHGSFDMLRCPLCDHVYFNRDGMIVSLAFRKTIDELNSCECGYGPLDPVLVAPSLIRELRDSTLLEIWRHAIEFMRRADHWMFAGYSFPPEDVAIRTLVLRALRGRDQPPRISVIQMGAKAETLNQYRLMFPNCGYERNGLEALIEAVRSGDPIERFVAYAAALPRIGSIAADDS